MTASDESPDDLIELAQAALDDGNPLTTVELCKQVLDRDPADVAAWFLEAEALRDLRENEDAEHSYRRAIELHPALAFAWSGLALTLYDQRRFAEAVACVQRALRLDATLADAWYTRALLRERSGDAAGARRSYLHAWRLSPVHPVPASLSDDDVRKLLTDAAGSVDDAIATWLQQVPVVVVDQPDDRVCEAYDPPASPAEVLGHLAAPAPSDSEWKTLLVLPPTMLLFRRNLERFAGDREQLLAVLRDSVVGQVQEWMNAIAVSE